MIFVLLQVSLYTLHILKLGDDAMMLSQHLTCVSEFNEVLITYYAMILESRGRPIEFYGFHVG